MENFEPESGPRLLDEIKAIRASVGDGLNDDEFTRLLHDSPLPVEAGFTFLSFSGGVVTLSVPPQDLDDWYPGNGWINPAKEKLARAIADHARLELFEPPDFDHSYLDPGTESPTLRHHIVLADRRETIVVAHPRYLKIRLYHESSATSGLVPTPVAACSTPGFLEALSALYQTRAVLARSRTTHTRFPGR